VIATGADLHESIQKVPDVENFFVLSAGDIPPDPTRLLSSKKMKEVMDTLQEDTSFDLVIYDTPPILGFADGRILATHTNGVILVAKLGQTDRTAFKQTVDQLRVSQVPILGLVANNVPRHKHGSYYYHYYGKRK
jgi:capsular exopolysaccharide synthesis family protein